MTLGASISYIVPSPYPDIQTELIKTLYFFVCVTGIPFGVTNILETNPSIISSFFIIILKKELHLFLKNWCGTLYVTML